MLNVLLLSATEQWARMPTITCGQLHRGIKDRRCCMCSAVSRVHEGSTLTGSAEMVLRVPIMEWPIGLSRSFCLSVDR